MVQEESKKAKEQIAFVLDQGIVGSVLLLLGFLGWLVLHAMVRRRFKKIVLWQDYKEPKPFWFAPGSE